MSRIRLSHINSRVKKHFQKVSGLVYPQCRKMMSHGQELREKTTLRAHVNLTNRYAWYNKWHQHPHHKKVHYGVLALHTILMVSLVLSSILPVLLPGKAGAATNIWNFGDPSDYTYDSSKVVISSGMAQLKTDPNAGSGADGAVVLSSSKNINTDIIATGRTCADGISYSIIELTANTATLASEPSAGCLSTGDDVLIVNLQGTSSAFGNVGNYEMIRIQSISSSSVTFATSKTKYYGDGVSDDTNIGTATTNQRVMLQRIPNYTNVTINGGATLTASAWDGTKGGVIFFKASGTVTNNGTILASSLGYRGGDASGGYETFTCGYAGEGHKGVGGRAHAANGSGGGAGGSALICGGGNGSGGGGGGGHSAAGSDGASNSTYNGQGSGGSAVGSSQMSQLFFGGAGGGSGKDDNSDGTRGGKGGAGGGIIMIFADTLTNANLITAAGQAGYNACNPYGGTCSAASEVGGGGAGAGGSIFINTRNTTLGSGTVTALGGVGGTPLSFGGTGGTSSTGRILVNASDSISGTTNPTYGQSGNYFSSLNPTVVPNTGQVYSSISVFAETLGSGSTGTTKYQISPDDGSTWYWWSGAAWSSTTAGYAESNSASEISDHIATFNAGSSPKIFKWKAYLSSNGVQQVRLDGVSIAFTTTGESEDNWNFDSSADYTYDSEYSEITSNSARLKQMSYSTDDNTKGLWHFDETEGTSGADSSGNSNTATLQNSATFASARDGNGISLSGNNQYASVADSSSLSLSSALTMEAYTKFNSAFDSSADVSMGVLDKGNYKLYFDASDGKLKFEMEGSGAKSWSKIGEDVGTSWTAPIITTVRSMAEIGTDLYVGLAGGGGAAEVWKYNGSAWSKIGGDDLNNSWNGSDFETVETLIAVGTKLYAGLGNSYYTDAEVWEYESTNTTWTKIGGDSINSSWSNGGIYGIVHSLVHDGTYLYAGTGYYQGYAEVWRWNGTSWTRIGGSGINSSWPWNVYETVRSMAVIGSTLYAGLGDSGNDAEVWSWNGTTWTQIGGDSLNSGWGANYEMVFSMAVIDTTLYAGLGASAGDAEVWSWNGSAWTKVGGDTVGSSWNASDYEVVYSLVAINGTLYAGLGNTANDAEVWSYNGSTWTKIGGDAVNSSWQYNKEDVFVGKYGNDLVAGTGWHTEDPELWRWNGSAWSWIAGRDWNQAWAPVQMFYVCSMAINDGKLYAGFGPTNKQAVVWQYDGTNWSHVGGNNVNSSWTEEYDTVRSLISYRGKLYAGLGDSTGEADVFEFNGTDDWTQIGGDAINSSWAAATYEQVRSMAVHQDALYAGLASGNGDGEVWKYSSGSWTKVGGDGFNSSWATAYHVLSMISDGSYLYAGTHGDASNLGDAQVWRWNGSSWSMIGGDNMNSSWNRGCFEETISSAGYNNKEYFGMGYGGGGKAEVWEWSGSAWSVVGGNGVNSSWPANTYEQVSSLVADASYLYAGLGSGTGDAETWRYNGSIWEKIGGDTVNSSWADNTYEYVYTMASDGTNLYAGLAYAAGEAEVWKWNGSSWSKIGGDGVNSSWPDATYEIVRTLIYSGSTLYAGLGDNTNDAEVWSYNGSVWSKIGGDGVNSSWNTNYELVHTLTMVGTTLYAGLGANAGDAEVWAYADSTWSKVGGDAANSSWADGTYEYVLSSATDGTNLYVGLGVSANEAEVWKWNGSVWAKVGGDYVNSSWDDYYFETARTLLYYNSTLYAGLGNTACTDDEVWSYNGTTWTKIGGDGVNNGMEVSSYDGVASMAIYQGQLYVGLGYSTGEAEVWRWNGTSWALIGGDGVNSSWPTGEFEAVFSMVTYDGELYASLGNSTAGDGDVWKWNGTSWAKIGGDGMNSSWAAGIYESVETMAVYNGKLIVGTGVGIATTNVSDGEVWAYGGNQVLASAQSSWDTNWHHVAVTYNGSTAKIFIDGVENASGSFSVSLADGALPLYIGSTLGTIYPGDGAKSFAGKIDEVRISNMARASLYSTPYASTAKTVQPNAALDDSDVTSWSGFAAQETENGGTITYRLSDNGGTGWKYWNGSAWVASASTSQANSADDIDNNIATFPVTNDGVLWQAILVGDGDQQVTLGSVQISYVFDNTDPTNPDSLTVDATCGTTAMTVNDSGDWCNDTAPSFTWSGATDAGSGIEGYFVYFGTSATAEPRTAGAFQTGSSYSASNLTSGQTYYLRIRAKDKAENWATDIWDAFTYKFDSTAPTPPAFVSVSPSGYTSSQDFIFLWPNTGSSAASDTGAPTTGSNIAGYQYKTGATNGIYSDWSATTTDTQISLTDVPYQDGENTFKLRVVDNAGNVSGEITATFYYAGNAPSAPRNLSVLPVTSVALPSVENSFSFSWTEPEFYNGSIKYYRYSVNALPTNTNTSTIAATSLPAGPYANQQGKNTLFVVAEDEAGNVNYNVYASVDFYAQTPAPNAPTAIQLFDISNRDTQEYAVSIKWTEPSNKGTGFNGYEIYRSIDDLTYNTVGTTAGTTYTDTNLNSIPYFYYIKAKDNAGQYSVKSSTVNIIPTGRYTSPPKLTDNPIPTTKAFSASIAWETDRNSSSFIEYGVEKDKVGKEAGGKTVGALEQTKKHAVQLDGLQPETTYYYRSVWIDSDGNRGESVLDTFQTGLRPKISDVSISNITLSSASITWTSTTIATSTIAYGKSVGYGATATDQSGSQTTKHTLNLSGLEHSSTYHFQITGTDTDGNTLVSDDYSFNTLVKPTIENLRFESVKDAPTSTVRFTWKTNVPTTSVVYYQTNNDSTIRSNSDAEYATDHDIQVKDLIDQSTYSLWVKSVDTYGNDVTSDKNTFTTPDDSRPPKLKNLTLEIKSSGYGSTQKAQLVATWETDEPSTSQLEYSPGISGKEYNFKTKEDPTLSTSHVVIASELEPSKIYHLRAVSRDKATNTGTTEDTTVITGKVQQSVIDIILNSLQRSLGWMFNVFGSR